MSGNRLSSATWLLASLMMAGAGCADALPTDALEGPSDPVEAARTFVEDAVARRRALEASIAVADTRYGRLRSEHYALAGAGIDDPDRDWDELPLFAPRVRALRVTDGDAEVDLEEGPVVAFGSLVSREDWERAGAIAFERAPAQIDLALYGLHDRATAVRAGLSVSEEGLVRGAGEGEAAAGGGGSATCGACHAAEREGVRVAGVPNERLDLGALGLAEWPRGTIDVTDDAADDPVRPSDLRPIASQARLHQTGSLANGRLARMVRVETLLVTQYGMRARPDRRMVAALALYLEALGRALPAPDSASGGARAFEATCSGCHRGEALAGPPVAAALVGTDPRSTSAGSERATLGYRAPSLLGAGDRRGVLHDGSAPDLDALLGLAPSTHVGHSFGRSLDEPTRRAIATFLRGP